MERSRNYYKKIIENKINYLDYTKNIVKSFIFGGLLGFLGQVYINIISNFLNKELSYISLSMLVILVTAILTGYGIYDKIGNMALCGLSIPISGFSNSIISAAMEYKNEGIILGIASNTLKLAGSVIVIGTSFSILIGILYYIVGVFI